MPRLSLGLGAQTIRKVGGGAAPSSLLSGLLAYWNLNTTSWLDSSGSGNTLTANGGVSLVSGKINNCANFDGDVDESVFMWLSRSNFFNFDSGNFSVSQWVYFEGSSYYQSLFSTRVDGAATSNSFSVVADLNNKLSFYDGGFTGDLYTFSGSNWYHLTTVRDGSTINFYVDGSFAASVAKSNPYEVTSIAMGGHLNGEEPLNGRIDEVGVWNRALTGAEITSLYNAGAGKTYPFN